MLGSVAIRSLFRDRGKLATALIGVIFSVVLVNVQGGLFLGLIRKASVLVDRSTADIWVGHRGMHSVDFPHDIPVRWGQRIAAINGVDEVSQMRVGFSEISLPDGNYEGVVVVGVDPTSTIGHPYTIVDGHDDALRRPGGIIVDQCDAPQLSNPTIGTRREIGGRGVRVTGQCFGVLSFVITPYVFTTLHLAAELTAADPRDTSYFLVSIGEDVAANEVCQRIESRIDGATAMTADEFSSTSVNFWMTRTGLGISFGAATMLGLFIGLVMVGQTLYAMVLDRITEFATLKAIGCSESEIVRVLVLQSATVAIIGIILGSGISFLIRQTLSTPQAEIRIPAALYVASGSIVFVICLFASALPYWRVRRVDPHTILQA